MKYTYLILLLIVFSSCKKKNTTLQAHPQFDALANSVPELSFPLEITWNAKDKPLQVNDKQLPDTAAYRKLVDSTANFKNIKAFGKVIEKDDFDVYLFAKALQPNIFTRLEMVSLSYDGKVIAKRNFEIRPGNFGEAKLKIDNLGFTDFTLITKTYATLPTADNPNGTFKTHTSDKHYQISPTGEIKDMGQNDKEDVEAAPTNFMSFFPLTGPMKVGVPFLKQTFPIIGDEYGIVKNPGWYVSIPDDTLHEFFPQVIKQAGETFQTGFGGYAKLYETKDFVVGLVVTRQMANQTRSGMNIFSLFTWDRKKRKIIDFYPSVAYAIESVDNESGKTIQNYGTFQFSPDLTFLSRDLEGDTETAKDNLRRGMINAQGNIVVAN